MIQARHIKLYIRQAAKVILNYRGQRGEIIRRWVFDLMHRFSPSIAVERNGIRYYVHTNDRELGQTVFALGNFEDDIMMRAIHFLESKFGRSYLHGKTFIDIGANIGTSTITAITVLGAERAIAIEPAPDNFMLLQCNLIVNDLTSRVTALQLALSDAAGTAVLELSKTNSGDNRIRELGAVDHLSSVVHGAVKVQTARFDDLMSQLEIDLEDVGLVWMDAQGHEGHILSGADTLLQSRVPIVMEYWPQELAVAGSLSTIHEIVAKNYDLVFDLRASILGKPRVEYAAAAMGDIEDIYRDSGQLTDLLLIKSSG